MRKQRWCGALLALALVLTLLPTAAFATGGTGTENDPILISTADDLKDFRDHVNGTGLYDDDANPALCARLTADIVLNDGTFDADGKWSESGTPEQWTPIGGYNDQGKVSYTGTFDGGGHSIKGLYINSNDYNIGLFGQTKDAIIKNLTVTGYVKGNGFVSGIVGHAEEDITIQNCVNYSSVTGESYVGGLVGTFNQGSIQNCANLGRVKGTRTESTEAGGIVGYVVNSTTMTACYNAGEVDGNRCVGGLVGIVNGSAEMTSCYNVGLVKGTERIGGLVGFARGTSVSNSYYLENTAETAIGYQDGNVTQADVKAKVKTEFANGDVLELLKRNDTTNAWGECGYLAAANMTLPLLRGQTSDNHTCTYDVRNYDAAAHWMECACGVIEANSKAAHFGGTATCKELATCEVCGEKYGALDPNRHASLTHVDAVAATTTAEGNIEYWYCTGCQKYYKNAAATDKITQEDTVTAKLPGSTPYYPPSYAASVSETEHGSVSVSPKTAAAGATVTVTVTPDQGYTLETLTVTDASGKELPLTDKGDGRFTFTQPSSKVTVTAAFMDDNTMLNFFADVKASDYFYDAVLWAAQKGITSGISATEFGPNQPCTRAQIVTFLWRAAGSPVVNYAMSMTDVPADAYYAEAVRWALSEGITTGTSADAFSPDAPCTRAQAVTFLARALNAKASGKAAFSDVPSGSYYADAVAWAAESGVTTGTSADAFSPDDVCTRAQIITFLYRAFQ